MEWTQNWNWYFLHCATHQEVLSKSVLKKNNLIPSGWEHWFTESVTPLMHHWQNTSLLEFDSSLKNENFLHIRSHTQRALVVFGCTFIHEQIFWVKFNKFRYRLSLCDNTEPDFNPLVQSPNRKKTWKLWMKSLNYKQNSNSILYKSKRLWNFAEIWIVLGGGHWLISCHFYYAYFTLSLPNWNIYSYQ